MRSRLILTALLMAAAAGPPAVAQQPQDRGGVQTETQRRLARGDAGIPWDLLGLFGLLGLLGLRRRHPDDSYHPSPVD
jgi:MYXO-CTERM domain-containing protein